MGTTLTGFIFALIFVGIPIEIKGEFGASYYYKNDPTIEKKSTYEHEENFPQDNLKTVVVIHGWNTETLERPLQIKDEIFKNRQDVGRVIVIDWAEESFKTKYGPANFKVAPEVAQFTAAELTRIITKEMTLAENIEIVAHSLGAHIAGQTGRKLIDNGIDPIGLITGLDPAGPGYFKQDSFYKNRLQEGDALEVLGIHTNAGTLGVKESISEHDIWVNGGTIQESCRSEKIWNRPRCSHSKAWDAYIDQLRGVPLYEKDDSSKGHDTRPKRPTQKTSVNILVLDISPSMQEYGRIQSLVIASNRFVQKLPLGYHLGIIVFGGYASASSEIVNITSEGVRKSLISVLPTQRDSRPYTCIGTGLRMALSMSKRTHNQSSVCADFILISDGEDNCRDRGDPSIAQVQREILNSCSKVNSIALGPDADPGLEQLSRETKGSMYTVSDTNRVDSSFDSLTQSLLDSSYSQLDFEQRPIQLPTKKAQLNDPNPTIYTFDESVGQNTQFALSSPDIENTDAVITDPNGFSYGRSSYDVNPNNKEIVFRFDEVMAGNWSVVVKPSTESGTRRKRNTDGDEGETVTIFVTTNPKSGEEEPIRLDALLSSSELKYPNPVKIEAGIMKGENRIISAVLHAHIKSSDGDLTVLQLWDNGAGADEMKNDGVYSRYISQLHGAGRYEVSVIATGGDETVFVKNREKKATGPFERLVNVGSIKAVGKFVSPLPGTVTDLNVISVNTTSKLCTIMWTAPGAEADDGKVTAFEIRASTNLTGAEKIETAFLFSNENLLNPKELEPKESGEIQIVNLKIPDELWDNASRNEDDVVPIELYFTVQSRNNRKVSNVSNIADTFTYFQSLQNGASCVNIALAMIFTAFLMQLYLTT